MSVSYAASDGPTQERSATPTESTETYSEEAVVVDFGFLPIPARLRFDPNRPVRGSHLLLNVTFAISSTFVIANLYYCQPLLIQLADSFHVSYDEVSNVPTLVQVGYAVGILLISPLGDLVRRRPLVLAIVFVAASLSIGLAFTNNLRVFEVLSFLVGMFTIVPQVLVALAADLAPPHRRASAMSIVMSGLLFGVLTARVLAGVVAEYVSWRVVYYIAFASQYAVALWLYLVVPDYPPKDKDTTYWRILWTMAKLAVTEPLIVQAVLILIPNAAVYANFWVTLTFLLGGPPYQYSTLIIGLFGFVGMVGVTMSIPVGRLIDRLVPWLAAIVSIFLYVVVTAIGVGADGINIASVVIVCIGVDVLRQTIQMTLTTWIFGVLDPKARSRIYAIILFALFLGQIMGTSVGALVFTEYGWRPSAAVSLAWSGFMILIIFMRGPHVPRYRWFGYAGGLVLRKSRVDGSDVVEQPDTAVETEEAHTAETRVRRSSVDMEAKGKQGDIVYEVKEKEPSGGVSRG
ncbi:major facilitator superfamily domain-containing protein [Fomitopsis serialis]|uniref:major facilitator superfamily domain-containing protein n=1 Tax=Fomitopsis serialis TaxID=139415 RepID=UPI002007E7AE|nr:major facilitator superfamily domain-containing protein [Neoantrodia serialis]KAH9919339.1 major facilitator superfamily domain-containing protein [Neoantrodia serialis]